MEKRHDGRNLITTIILIGALIAGFFWMLGQQGPSMDEVYCDGFSLGTKTAQVRAMQMGNLVQDEDLPPCPDPATGTDANILFCEGTADGYIATLEPLAGPPPESYKAEHIDACLVREIPRMYYETGAGSRPSGGGPRPQDS